MKLSYLWGSALIGISFGFAFTQSAVAQWQSGAQWRDSSDDLVITVMAQWGRSCASGTAQASYQVAGGSEGLLYPDDCDDNTGRYRFEDTEGVERCVGFSMLKAIPSSSPAAIDTSWTIEGSVAGFPCSTVGQTYNVRLFHSASSLSSRSPGSSSTAQPIEWLDVQNSLAPADIGTNTIVRRGNQITFDAIADGQYVRYDGNCQTEMLYRLKIGLLDSNRQPQNVTAYGNERWFPVNDYQAPILSTACSMSQ